MTFAEKVDNYTQRKRLKTCKECNWYRKDFWIWFRIITIPGRSQCIQCKCDLLKKTKLKYENCPIDKW